MSSLKQLSAMRELIVPVVIHDDGLKQLKTLEIYGVWLAGDDEKWLSQTLPNTDIHMLPIQRFQDTGGDLIHHYQASGYSQSAYDKSHVSLYQTAKTWQRPMYIAFGCDDSRKQISMFQDVENLKGMSIQLSDQNYEILQDLANFSSLENLNLYSIRANDDLRNLTDCKLTELKIGGSALTQSGLRHLTTLPLQSLRVSFWSNYRTKFVSGESELGVLKKFLP